MEGDALQGLERIGQVRMPVQDLERAVAFYRDALGVRFLFEVPQMAFFDCAGVRLMLGVAEGEGFDPPGSILYFKVARIEEATETLRARGVKIVEEPELVAEMPDHDLWMSFFEDTEGNTLALIAELPRPERQASRA